MVWQIVLVWMAVCLTVLVVYLLTVLKTAKETLTSTKDSLEKSQRELAALTEEATRTMRTAGQIAEDVQAQVNQAKAFVQAVSDCGSSVQHIGESLRQVASVLSAAASRVRDGMTAHQSKMAEIGEWIAAGCQLWQKCQASDWKKRGERPSEGEEQDER